MATSPSSSSLVPLAPQQPGVSATAAVDQLYGPRTSIYERFGNMDGVLLQKAVWQAYAVVALAA